MAGNDSNTVLLISPGGSDGGTTFTDESVGGGHGNGTTGGDAQIDDAYSPVGENSILFDGTGDYVTFAADADFAFGTGDFTIDFRMDADSLSTYTPIIGAWDTTANNTDWRFYATGGNTLNVDFGGANIVSASLSTGTSYHIALERDGTDVTLFVDGTAADTATDSTNIGSNYDLEIGRGYVTSLAYYTGHLAELRISKGVARYGGANFTPPDSPYTSEATASGSVTAQAATTTAAAEVEAVSSGSVNAQAATTTGVAALTTEASGEVTGDPPTTSGNAVAEVQASGSVTAQDATGTGELLGDFIATGSVTAQDATTTAAAEVEAVASGAVTAQAPTTTAAAKPEVVSSGTVTAAQASISGIVVPEVILSGNVTPDSPTASGATAIKWYVTQPASDAWSVQSEQSDAWSVQSEQSDVWMVQAQDS